MANCKIKTNINYNVLNITGVKTPYNINQSMVSKQGLINALKSKGATAGLDNAAEIDKDHLETANALEKVDKLEDYGLLLTREDNIISQEAKNFIGRMLVNKQDMIGFINTIGNKGYLNLLGEENLIEEGGKLVAKKSLARINSNINQYLQKDIHLKGSKEYVTQNSNGTIKVSEDLALDYNNLMYSRYLQKVGTLANLGRQRYTPTENTKSEFESMVDAEVESLMTEPIEAHIKMRVSDLFAKRRQAKNTGDTTTTVNIEKEIRRLQTTKTRLNTAVTKQEVLEYLSDILEDTEELISGKFVSPTSVKKALSALTMIQNAGKYTADNPILSFDDMKDEEFMNKIGGIVRRATKLTNDVDIINNNLMLEEVKAETNLKDLTLKDMFSIKNLDNSFSRMMQNVRGFHQIDNPLVQYIALKAERATIKGFRKAAIVNDTIEKLHKKAKDANFNTEVFFQKDSKGRINGRMTDVFSEKYWKSRRKLYTDYKLRQNNAISMNPQILFELDPTNETRINLENKFKDLLKDMYSTYLDDARTKWENYKTAREVFISSGKTAQEIREWELDNSPVERISNYNNQITVEDKRGKEHIRGHDDYLILIPERTNLSGKDLGYYDSNYDKILQHKEGKALYKAIRDNFIATEMAMNREYSKFKPPLLGYVSKSVTELVKKGAYKDALELAKTKSFNSVTTGLFNKGIPKDPITGEIKMELVSSLHSIEDEIEIRVNKELQKHPTYADIGVKTAEDRKARKTIREGIKDRVASEVEKERSSSFLEAITLTNYATSALIEKSMVETEINLATNIMKSEFMKYPKGDEAFGQARKLVNESLLHYLGVKFYDLNDKEISTFINPTTAEKAREAAQGSSQFDDERGVTTRNISKMLLNTTRLLSMGWSPILSMYNLGHGLISNFQKSASVPEFTTAQLANGYKNIFLPKNRKLIEKLYVLGDVAFLYDKTTLHARGITDWFHSMRMQSEVEKINQGATALAILQNSTVTNSKTGVTTSVYNALDENQNLSDEWESTEYPKIKGDDLLIELTLRKIRPINMQAHGDYLSPLLLERSELGKLALMFKKFLPEMVQDRFGAEKYDARLGRAKVGRYIGTLNVLKRIAQGQRAGASEAELEALRATATEMVMAIVLKVFAAVMTNQMCHTKECRNQQGINLFLLNSAEKMATDAMMFIWPKDVLRAVMDPFAVNSLINDLQRTASLAFQTAIGSEEAYYKYDTEVHDAGDSKLAKQALRLIPVVRTNYVRYQQLSNKLFNGSFMGAVEDVPRESKKIQY